MKDRPDLKTAGSLLWLAVKFTIALLALLSLSISSILYQGY